MTKYLAKAKKGCTFIATNASGEFLDEYRFRVFSNANDIREWDSRKLIEIYGQLRDDASDAVLKSYLAEEGGLERFYNEFALDRPVAEPTTPAPVKEEEEVVPPAEEEVVPPPVEVKAPIVTSKKNKHSKHK